MGEPVEVLVACRYCGDSGPRVLKEQPPHEMWFARCGYCGARGPTKHRYEEARDVWNGAGRAPLSPEIREAIREALKWIPTPVDDDDAPKERALATLRYFLAVSTEGQ